MGLCTLKQVLLKDLLYLAPFLVPSILISPPVPASEKHPHSMMLPPPCFMVGMVLDGVMSCARFPPEAVLYIQAKEFNNYHLIRPQHILSHVLRAFHVPFCKLQACCHVPFSQEWLSAGHSPMKPRFVKFCRDCCPSGRFSHLGQGTL